MELLLENSSLVIYRALVFPMHNKFLLLLLLLLLFRGLCGKNCKFHSIKDKQLDTITSLILLMLTMLPSLCLISSK